MLITNGKVFLDGEFVENKNIYTEGKWFQEEAVAEAAGNVEAEEQETLDAEGCYVIPGPIDIHFHGSAGYDFCDGTPEALHAMAVYELQQGITTIHPASMTLSEERLNTIFQNAVEFYKAQQADESRLETEAELAGIYMEGPFICMAKKGAQNPEFVNAPDLGMFHRLQETAEGLIHICIVAPEEEGAEEFIEKASKEVTVSIGHTSADYDQAAKGFALGASEVTHLYNAMPPFTHRAPGVIGAACDDAKTRVEMICDGIHLHPSTIRTSFKMFGSDRIIMISDSMSATGMEDGAYELGGQAVTVRGKLATLTEGGAIAGSATNLFDCMRYAVQQAGIPLEQVIPCATANPAKAAGLYDRYGSIEAGKYADCVIMDEDMKIKYVIKHGKTVITA